MQSNNSLFIDTSFIIYFMYELTGYLRGKKNKNKKNKFAVEWFGGAGDSCPCCWT